MNVLDNAMYLQCQLDRGNESQVAWMPVDIAKQGLLVKYRTEGESEWSTGWTVAKVYGKPRSGEVLNKHDRWRRKHSQSVR